LLRIDEGLVPNGLTLSLGRSGLCHLKVIDREVAKLLKRIRKRRFFVLLISVLGAFYLID
tara:strand:+ start:231 stop:410 length:180 start_codon:yes stop_codon:yes gene_type:complete